MTLSVSLLAIDSDNRAAISCLHFSGFGTESDVPCQHISQRASPLERV
jgi:hypothetical protein